MRTIYRLACVWLLAGLMILWLALFFGGPVLIGVLSVCGASMAIIATHGRRDHTPRRCALCGGPARRRGRINSRTRGTGRRQGR
jgi:hypothetical protein